MTDNTFYVQKTPFTHDEFYKRYYVHRIAVSAFVLRNKAVLLVKQVRSNRLQWGLPGGMVEKNESFVDAVKREVIEETNVIIEPESIISVSNWAGKSIFPDNKNSQSGTAFIMKCRYISGEPEPKDIEEIYETRFFEPEEYKNIEYSKHISKYLQIIENKNEMMLEVSEYTDKNHYRYSFNHFI